MSSGWVRWIFEKYKFPFQIIYAKEIDASNLKDKFDVIVFATGFKASDFLSPMKITGINGQELLRDCWAGDCRAYLGIMAPGFPNLFMVHGPGSPGVFYNMPLGAERQMNWIGSCMRRLREKGLCALATRVMSLFLW